MFCLFAKLMMNGLLVSSNTKFGATVETGALTGVGFGVVVEFAGLVGGTGAEAIFPDSV